MDIGVYKAFANSVQWITSKRSKCSVSWPLFDSQLATISGSLLHSAPVSSLKITGLFPTIINSCSTSVYLPTIINSSFMG